MNWDNLIISLIAFGLAFLFRITLTGPLGLGVAIEEILLIIFGLFAGIQLEKTRGEKKFYGKR